VQYNTLATVLQGCAHELGGVQRADDVGRWRGNLTVLIMLTKARARARARVCVCVCVFVAWGL
jgi:hypothetical protein